MTSTRSSRKRTVGFGAAFLWHLRKNQVPTLIYTLLLLVLLPAWFFLTLTNEGAAYTDAASIAAKEVGLAATMSKTVITQLTAYALPLLVVMALILSVSSFGYLHSRRAVDLYGSFPVRRVSMLFGGMAANLVEMLAPLALSLGIVQALGWGYADLVYPFSAQLLWQPFGLMALTGFAMYLIFLFLIVTTGTLLDAALCGGIYFLAWPCLLYEVTYLAGRALPGFLDTLSTSQYTVLIPAVELFFQMLSFSVSYCYLDSSEVPEIDTSAMPIKLDLWLLIWWVVLTVLLFVLVLVCFLRRKNEVAESPDAFPAPRAVLRVAGSLAGGIGLGVLFASIVDSNWVFALGAVVGCFLTHLILQAIWGRGLKGFTKTLPGYAVTVVLLCGGAVTLCYDLTGYVSLVPAESEIASITVTQFLTDIEIASGDDLLEATVLTGTEALNQYLSEQEYDTLSYNGYAEISPTFTDADSIEALRTIHSNTIQGYSKPYLPFGSGSVYNASGSLFRLTYTLRDGSTVERHYTGIQANAETEALNQELRNSETVQELRQLRYLTGSCVSSISFSRNVLSSGEESGYYYYNEAYGSPDNYAYLDELTDEQKETLWTTFLSELQSDSFTYTANECSMDSYDYSSWEDIPSEYFSYNICVNELWPEDFSDELIAVLEKYLGDEASEVESVGWSMLYPVPSSCTKTRALIDEYLGRSSDSDSDSGTNTADTGTDTAADSGSETNAGTETGAETAADTGADAGSETSPAEQAN